MVHPDGPRFNGGQISGTGQQTARPWGNSCSTAPESPGPPQNTGPKWANPGAQSGQRVPMPGNYAGFSAGKCALDDAGPTGSALRRSYQGSSTPSRGPPPEPSDFSAAPARAH